MGPAQKSAASPASSFTRKQDSVHLSKEAIAAVRGAAHDVDSSQP